MRNTLQHPITYTEALAVLKEAYKKASYETTGLVGSLDGMILKHLVDNFGSVWEDIYVGQEHYSKE